ncbi:hypothetical protein C5C18_01505 [Rathayibacter tritici]|uniref:hypothetical protein n=1 Tax=Rathayibacter tritici TaxID=33888 RepID=UPI000CE75AE0|nr:hypothetical protein [Rathayibacter tritici]PPF30545.1 hypothetical protein C5C06_04710 [Rathayibacter tritici]PPF66700.1 hypothetical protein C5C21_08520 [Rathayibacter tritici]PPG09085.1 hypothetical protein C5C18_01505 [Rathayibacter tritici]PPI17843.1 hypothetical protein C5D07_04105 [Rathayibacter tritici]
MPSSPRSLPSRSGLSRRSVVIGGLAVLPLLSACTPDSSDPDADQEAPRTRTAAPSTPVVPAADALAASAALFASAPLVVLVEDVAESRLRAAQVSIAWGVPLLVGSAESSGATAAPTASAADATDSADASESATQTPSTQTPSTPSPSAPTADALAAEFTRLGVTRVLAIGDVTAPEGVDVVVSAPDAASLRTATGVTVADLALADLAAAAPSTASDAPFGTLPTRADPLTGVHALARAHDADVAALATARAAGVPVTVVDGDDLLASGDAVSAIADADASCTLLLGPALAAQSEPEWAVRAAASGWQLPGGGQRLFGGHLFVAIYGTPGAPVLGVLGEQGLESTITRAEAVAEPYRALTGKQVVPSLEIITTVAAGDPGKDGDYSSELDAADLRPYIDAAQAAGMYVVLDLQSGLTDFLTQAQQYADLLKLPNVGLALDPEWRLLPGQKPLQQIGRVSAAEVDSVSEWLADLVQSEGLPPKMFVLHQFQLSMLQDRESIRRDRPELEFLIHVDGQGSQPDKQATWDALHEGAPEGIAWGWKNFYDEDKPMLTPAETMAEVRPLPDLVTYQ